MLKFLNEQYPDASEGELARRYNRLVRGEACAKVARNTGLGAHLILSESEADSGGREKTTILADAAEALLGAVFIDGGFEKARAVVRKLWQEQSEPVPEVAVDAKSALQEWAQGQGLALPKYTVVAAQGPRSRAAFHGRSDNCRQGAGARRGRIEAHRRAGSRNGVSEARRRWRSLRCLMAKSSVRLTTDAERRCGFVAMLGATNAGKSTLVNALVGAKVAIMSHKVQTTRCPIAASPSKVRARSCSSTRPAFSIRSAGSTGPWSMRRGAVPRMPTPLLLVIDA